MLGFHLGFPGSGELGGVSEGLDSTLGVNLRADFPVARYLLIGPLFQFGVWHPELASSHHYYLDLDLFLRGRVPLDLGENYAQFWGGVPIGFSLNVFGASNDPAVSDAGWGWNIGFLFGAAFHWKSGFGLFVELGWLQHRVSHAREQGGSLDLHFAQWNANLGFAFKN
jgi:hypothetical protein